MAGNFGMGFDELASAMGVSVWTLYRLANKNLIRTIYVGCRRIVPADEIARLQREGAPTPRPGRRPRKAASEEAAR